MKRILTITALLVSQVIFAKTYYVSNAGNDANSGTSTGSSWATIKKVNSFSFAANDIVLFNRGDVFYGGITVRRSNISFGAYGSGANPIITGLSTVTGWVNIANNIWEAPVTDVKSGVNLVLRNNTPQQVGRYPNTDADNGGYLTYTTSTANSITGPAQSSTTNWTGAEVAIKLNRWSILKQKVTSHSGGTVNFATMQDVPRPNYGYFFQRDSRTLDRDGEWWHNLDGRKLRMYFSSNNPNSFTTQISTVDTLFKCQYFSNITLSDLSFTGADERSVWINAGSVINVKNCTVSNSGGEAITVKSSTNVTIDNCTITNSLGAGINLNNPTDGTVNLLIQNCTVSNTAYIAGMEGGKDGNGGEGIKCVGGDGIRVYRNKITNSGYSGIKWQGNDVYIKYNFVDRFCFLRDDGAGIYSWEDPTKPETRRNRNIVSNIILNGIGSLEGTNDEKTTAVQGLYFDLGSKNIIVDSNTVAHVTSVALHGNNCANLTITNNVFFDNLRSTSLQRFAGADLLRNITIKKNVMHPYRFRYKNLGINSPAMTREADIRAMGIIDSNYYLLGPKTDTSLIVVTTDADNSNYEEGNLPFSYLTGTIGIEKHSSRILTAGTLEYNASNSPKIVSLSGLSVKDVLGNIFNNSVTIPAWGSKILFPNGSASTSNKPPVAIAGNSLSIILPIATVTLNGRGTDSDGVIVKYSWAKIAGPSTGVIVTPLGAVTVILNLGVGTYQYELTVTDDDGSTGKDTVQVTVTSLLGNKLPVANAGTDKSITLPSNTVTLTGSGTDTDGTIARYSWTKISGPSAGTIVSPLNSSTTLVNLEAGVYQYQLTVTDDDGGTATDIVQVTVNPAVVIDLHPAVNPANTVNGLDYKYFEGTWLQLPSFPDLTPVETGASTTFDIGLAQIPENFGFSFTGYITVPADGMYTFYSNSDDGSEIYIDNILVVENDGLHGPVEESGTIGLKAGKHAITGLYFQKGGGAVFEVLYESNNISKQAIPESALYRVSSLLPAVNPANTVNGLDYKYYKGEWLELPSFPQLTPVKSGTVSNFDLTPATDTQRFGFTYTGYINVPADGIYNFYTSSDDGTELFIDNILVVSNDGLHGPIEVGGVVGLRAGKHALRCVYFQRGGGATLRVSYSSGAISKRVIPSSALYRVNTAIMSRSAMGNSLGSGASLNLVSQEFNENTAFKISSFPNPSSADFGLKVEGGSDKKVEIMVMSADGRAVFKSTGSTNKIYRFGYNFMPGLYIVKVMQENKSQTLKVIKISKPR